MNNVMIILTIIYLIIYSILIYYIGYIKGFKKSKAIDDKIIRDLANKYK